jgi:hypothetical protein
MLEEHEKGALPAPVWGHGEELNNHYVVSFKCNRSEIFFIPTGSGLKVRVGDSVMVEADRGHDLGMVVYANLTMAEAKMRKEEKAYEHHYWLCKFSPRAKVLSANAQKAATSKSGTPLFIPGEQHGGRAKLIRGLARPHEIQLLTEKEGNEERAKRICIKKVEEHGLPMEILDAEFQLYVDTSG